MPPRLAAATDQAALDLQRELTRLLGPSYSLDDLYRLVHGRGVVGPQRRAPARSRR